MVTFFTAKKVEVYIIAMFLQTVALMWNVGYPRRTESPSGYVYAKENSPA